MLFAGGNETLRVDKYISIRFLIAFAICTRSAIIYGDNLKKHLHAHKCIHRMYNVGVQTLEVF
jgi:hypothetical protein